jgi:hypothetical protein
LKLLKVVRTQYVNQDSFGCVYEAEDSIGKRGVRLSKEIVKVAGRAMEKNFTTLGPYVLPLSEQIKTGFWMFLRYLSRKFSFVSVLKYCKFCISVLVHSLTEWGSSSYSYRLEKSIRTYLISSVVSIISVSMQVTTYTTIACKYM